MKLIGNNMETSKPLGNWRGTEKSAANTITSKVLGKYLVVLKTSLVINTVDTHDNSVY